jgi:hypothetical protein
MIVAVVVFWFAASLIVCRIFGKIVREADRRRDAENAVEFGAEVVEIASKCGGNAHDRRLARRRLERAIKLGNA